MLSIKKISKILFVFIVSNVLWNIIVSPSDVADIWVGSFVSLIIAALVFNKVSVGVEVFKPIKLLVFLSFLIMYIPYKVVFGFLGRI